MYSEGLSFSQQRKYCLYIYIYIYLMVENDTSVGCELQVLDWTGERIRQMTTDSFNKSSE